MNETAFEIITKLPNLPLDTHEAALRHTELMLPVFITLVILGVVFFTWSFILWCRKRRKQKRDDE